MSHKYDWMETLHQLVYRFLRGKVYESQYVGTVKMGEEELEKTVFHPHGVERNLPAYWKYHADDERDSEGSWRITHDTHPSLVPTGYQVHFTIFNNLENNDYIDVYAHYEIAWDHDPLAHIREHNFSASKGVNKARTFFDKTYAKLYHKDDI